MKADPHPTMPLLDPARGLQRPTNELRTAFQLHLDDKDFFFRAKQIIYRNTFDKIINPPVVESEHVVIVLHVILIEQHVNLNNVCSGFYLGHFQF